MSSESINCYNCHNDCMGILLDLIEYQEHNNPEAIFNMQFLISEKLADKGYHAVNLSYEHVDGKDQHVLQFEYTEVNRFVQNMEALGYTCRIIPAHKPRYKYVIFEDHTPMDLLHVYHYLEVIA